MALQFKEEWAGHFDNHDNSDKVWAATYAEDGAKAIYLAVWGRRMGASGSSDKYQSQPKNGSLEAMRSLFRSKVREKEGKGYVQVPFNDPQHGSIPSFSGGSVAMPAGDGRKITADNLLAQIEGLLSRLARGARGLDMSMFIMEFQQVKAKVEIFIEFGGASGDEKVKIANRSGQLQTRLQTVLVG